MGFRYPRFSNVNKRSTSPELVGGNLTVWNGNSPHKSAEYNNEFFAHCLHNFSQAQAAYGGLTEDAKNAEQEYIIASMVKGAIQECHKLARKYDCSIVVRPTSYVAHMGNEAGNPTKPAEIKN